MFAFGRKFTTATILRFLFKESGAVTVDFIVLTATTLTIGFSMVNLVASGAISFSNNVEESLSNATVDEVKFGMTADDQDEAPGASDSDQATEADETTEAQDTDSGQDTDADEDDGDNGKGNGKGKGKGKDKGKGDKKDDGKKGGGNKNGIGNGWGLFKNNSGLSG